jgi:hypothetical protein
VGTVTATERVRNLRRALSELASREFDASPGHLTALLSCCAFAPSVLTFWLVNGVLDFSTAVVIGAVGGPGGLAVRLVAYVLLLPTFLGLRVAYYLAHPVHRRSVLAGSCPTGTLLSLDWVSVGILATGLPFALQDLGPWLGMNGVFLLGVFLLPRLTRDDRTSLRLRVGAIVAGTLLFAYASYGAALADLLPLVPDPATAVGPVATLRLSDATTGTLVSVTNSLVTGPPVVALFALSMNRLLTRPELVTIPYLRRSLPRRDPAGTVLGSAALGTVFYLGVVWLWTGRAPLLPA